LSIVNQILNRLGGRIEISSTLGVGSTFTVMLQQARVNRSGPVTQMQ
jgi:signal transduction histidine kinase